MIAVGMIPNTRDYPYGANRRYTWQRWTGLIAFVFIVYHVFHMHGWFHFDAWLKKSPSPYGGAQLQAVQRRLDRRQGTAKRRHAGVLRGRRVGLRVPLRQRPVDDGHHLGRLDQPASPSGARSASA